MSSISWRVISSVNASRSAATARGASVSGTVKQIECSDDACEIIDTETPVAASAPKVRAATPGTPSIPFPCTVTSACLRIAESARTGEPPAGRPGTIVVPADSGFANGPDAEDRPLLQRHERARMQHLGAVVRQLGRLARVEQRDDARVGDEARIRRHAAGRRPSTA